LKIIINGIINNKLIKLSSLLLFLLISFNLFSQDKKITSLTSNDNVNIVLPLKNLAKTASFYSVKLKKNNVRFFAILDSLDKVHVAFDACDVCYEARKGYKVINNLAICNNCGNRYPLNLIGKDNIYGGCWPSYLPVKEVNNNAVIKISDLEAKRYLFP